ncbi:MAG: hypothetical protein KatS3mg105_0705 [Gemmatales bacterium]|nr:MAG: hypothetical protein KatS3mg105_0705 [Gemmatales bacterium]
MTGKWLVSCGLMLSLAWHALGEEIQWRPASRSDGRISRPAATLGRPIATLGRPIPGAKRTIIDNQVQPVSLGQQEPLSEPTIRAQSPAYAPPTLAPPTSQEEKYNAGVVITPPGAQPSFFDRLGSWCGGWTFSDPYASRGLFQSDHEFDEFISPVSGTFLSEDPRSLTEIRPIYIYQSAPSEHYIFRGGNIGYFGAQARLALTNRLSFVMNKFGLVWIEPHRDVLGFDDASGFSEIWLGPKYTLVRNTNTRTLLAMGLTFQIPAGPGKVFQDSGNASIAPYLSFAQHFGETTWGSFNFMNTTGYAFGTDSRRSDYFYTNFHLDFDVYNLHKFYPLVELNWSAYTQSGTGRVLGFEGRDLFNFGSTNVAGHDDLTIAVGARYKVSEAWQFGVASEWPLNNAKNLLNYRLTLDMILKY